MADQEVAHGIYAPGTPVECHGAIVADRKRREQKAPLGTPDATATVADDGTLEFTGLTAGNSYVAAGPVDHWTGGTAGKATGQTGAVGDNNAIYFAAVEPGVAGNAITIDLVDPEGNDQALAVTVDGSGIEVSLATDSSGDITTTAQDVINALRADPDAYALIRPDHLGASTGAGVAVPVEVDLFGGGNFWHYVSFNVPAA